MVNLPALVMEAQLHLLLKALKLEMHGMQLG
jgi:hypothetical protein